MLCFRDQAALVLQKANANTGLVLNCGHEVISATPIYEGSFFHFIGSFDPM